jgi:hypothetical protein
LVSITTTPNSPSAAADLSPLTPLDEIFQLLSQRLVGAEEQ